MRLLHAPAIFAIVMAAMSIGCGSTDSDLSAEASGGSAGLAGTGGTGAAGGETSCKQQCTGEHTYYDSQYDKCHCSMVYGDTDSDRCTATCVPRPIKKIGVKLTLEHAAVGDVTVKIFGPDGTTVTLLNRPGFAETADDGADGFGSMAAISRDTLLSFADDAALDAEELGAGLGSGDFVCADANQCSFKPFPGAAGGSTSLNAAFAGKVAAGTWKICIGDSNPGEAGVFHSRGLDLWLDDPSGSVSGGGPAGTYPDGVEIPDDAYDGTIASMGCDEMNY
jgi:subtilisin-like proprotein convertase family protein